MAIKRNIQQPSCTELLEMMSDQEAKITLVGNYIRLSKEECRIFKGRLIHRTQSVHIPRMITRQVSRPFYPPQERICLHLEFTPDYRPPVSLFPCTTFESTGTKYCEKCQTEYVLGNQYRAGHGDLMFFWRWKDLGSSPDDSIWEQHLGIDNSSSSSKISLLTALFRGRKSIVSDFENANTDTLESFLTPREEAELFRIQREENNRHDEQRIFVEQLYHSPDQGWRWSEPSPFPEYIPIERPTSTLAEVEEFHADYLKRFEN